MIACAVAFYVCGVFVCRGERNGLTNVCAHAALRAATAHFAPGGLSPDERNCGDRLSCLCLGIPLMKRRGRKAPPINFTSEQRVELERLARRKREARGPAFRTRVILMLAAGAIGREVEQRLRTSNQTVCALRKRFLEGGVEALFDERRPGAHE